MVRKLKFRMSSREVAVSALFASLTAVGAYITVPLWPVPITLQTFFVYLVIALFGARISFLSQVIYVAMGLAGLPVFAGGTGGPTALFRPSAGYLFGFIVAAAIGGLLVERTKRILPALIVATAIIYLFGYIYLAFWLHIFRAQALAQAAYYAFTAGILPFIVGDTLKMLVARYVASSTCKRFPRLISITRP